MPAPPPRRRIVIEFEPGDDPVTGTISVPPGTASEFCGWLELIATLDLEFHSPAADVDGASSSAVPGEQRVGWVPDANAAEPGDSPAIQ